MATTSQQGRAIRSAWAFKAEAIAFEALRQETSQPPRESAVWVDWWLTDPAPAASFTPRLLLMGVG